MTAAEDRRAYLKAWRAKNKAKVAEYTAASQAKRKERWDDFLADERRRYEARAEEICERQKRYRAKDPEKSRAIRRRYAKANAGQARAHCAAYRAQKKRAMPEWADGDRIKSLYIEARRLTEETGVPHEVDHIVPLQHKSVCGLHVSWNLQIVTREENRKKFNSFAPG